MDFNKKSKVPIYPETEETANQKNIKFTENPLNQPELKYNYNCKPTTTGGKKTKKNKIKKNKRSNKSKNNKHVKKSHRNKKY